MKMVLEFQLLPKSSSMMEEMLLKMRADERLVSFAVVYESISVAKLLSTGFQRYLVATDSNATLVYTGCDNDSTIWPSNSIQSKSLVSAIILPLVTLI